MSGDKLLVPATPTDAFNFALGAIDMLSVVGATLIGRGMLEPNAFQLDVKRYADHWREKGNPSRALAAELFCERLQNIEATKLKATAHLVVPETSRIN